ncbi:hypothetical protein K492DRAFT_148265 [Lichtheimia hyalospora FSU 10163]|nr:hypothetical protein K492DRAFT_148265 [Lichtheimia hyalospora FSU 10163]
MGKQRKRRDITNISDLATLTTEPNDNDICGCLKERYEQRQQFTWMGSKQLVILKEPCTMSTNEEHQTGLDYIAEYKDTSSRQQEDKLLRPPHIYELVNRMYFHMRRTGIDQVVTLCGEMGSGKTYARNMVTRQLVRLGSYKRESKIQTQFLHAQHVLDAFGTAPTLHNNDASRFGYYAELQFNDRGRMVGAKIIHHLFEKDRLTQANQHNFTVFYHLVADCSPEERNALQLQQGQPFRYLEATRKNTETTPDSLKQLKSSLKQAGFRREQVSRIMQLLAAILHLGDLTFLDPTNNQDAAYVKDVDQLNLVADFLGVDSRAFENVLVFKTTMIRKDLTTLILNAEQAAIQRDELARTLYALLFTWMVERINSKLCADEESFHAFISVLDLPGLQRQSPNNDFYSFLINVANERVRKFTMDQLLTHQQWYDNQGIDHLVTRVTPLTSIDKMTDLLERPSRGVCAVIESMTDEKRKKDITDMDLVDTLIKYNGNHDGFSVHHTSGHQQRQFAIQHFNDHQVVYDPNGFLVANRNQVSVDFVSLFLGGVGMQSSWNTFVMELWQKDMLNIQTHPRNPDAIVSAQHNIIGIPSRRQSQRQQQSTSKRKEDHNNTATSIRQLHASLDELIDSLEEANLWTVYCIQPNTKQQQGLFDTTCVMKQIKMFDMAHIARTSVTQHVICYTHHEFLERYHRPLQSLQLMHHDSAQSKLEIIAHEFKWSHLDAMIGDSKIFLSFDAWRMFEDQLRELEKSEQGANKQTQHAPGQDEISEAPPQQPVSSYSDEEVYIHPPSSDNNNDNSVYGSDSYTYDDMMLHGHQRDMEPDNLDETDEDESKQSATRRRWLFFVAICTGWIPSKCLVWCGAMKRKDVRIAWREKVALCMLIALMCAVIIWFLVFFGELVCPHQSVYSEDELASNSQKDKAYVAIRGEVFDLTSFAPHHYPSNIIPMDTVLEYGGQDISDLFPMQVSALCEGVTGDVSPYVSLNYQVNLTDDNAQYHDFRYSSGFYQPDWYYQQMMLLRKNFKLGHMGYEPKAISDQATTETAQNGIKTTRKWAYIDNHIYDLTTYDMGGRYAAAPPDQQPPPGIDLNFMHPSVVALFRQKSGGDITKDWAELALPAIVKQRQLVCLRNLFFVGMLDTRNSARCQFSTYLLLIVTCLLCAVIVFKFVAAFRIGSKRVPEELDKFVITQVTCYTEDDESLRKTINSLATLRYDDKRKLLFIICDGMIVGSGNDRPTPRIVLDILGVDSHVDPEPLSFFSVGEGQKQHNMGKIYSGLYETTGHVVPYLVVVKCGKPTERQKPGNRGKRDSQLILMEFLNCVHHDSPMSPLQLEMYHQMKNIIGVSPQLYEYVLMVDADTEVMPDSLSFMVSSMSHDSKIIGLCGETELNNRNASWISMIQVYEYFISHHMIKAFESLFSTVTCLPGCFTMYRIRSIDGRRALFCSNDIINDYHINKVDTLHMKNLLYLGEDRYLTTLLLKHFPSYKTKFVSHAQCKTNAPDQWSVLVSQRRRWINSTIHNLGELVFLPRLCGFCCFSMRFVVLMDLISTLVMPAMVGYLGYLIYKLATMKDTIPILTIIVLGGTYGLQALLFIVKRRWEYIMWMLVSIFAIPVFWFYIPLYSYWHFDDFSWGNTRIVVGEKGKKIAVGEEEEFDPKSIPTMTWSKYEKMLLTEDYWSDGMSQGSSSNSRSTYTHHSHVKAPTTLFNNNNSGDNLSMGYPQLSAVRSTTGFYTTEGGSMMIPSSASIPIIPVGYTTAMQPPPPVATSNIHQIPSHGSMSSFSHIQDQQRPQFMHMHSSATIAPDATLDGSTDRPTNEEIISQVKRILATSDLTRVTKKQVREELQQVYGVSMATRKDYINGCIEGVLQGRL